MLLAISLTVLTFSTVDIFGGFAGFVFLYLGPESMMPIASAIAGIIGAILIFWQRVLGWTRKVIKKLKGTKPVSKSSNPPNSASESFR